MSDVREDVLSVTVSPAIDLDAWRRDGFVILPEVFSGETLDALLSGVAEVASAPATSDEILQYDETLPDGSMSRCRTENFIPHHKGLRELFETSGLREAAGKIFGEDAYLYKEKINYKPAGGAGFAPHQDAAAYPNVSSTVACLVAIDDFTVENGCLEVATGQHSEPLPMSDVGIINDDVVEGFSWEPITIPAGTAVFFHGLLPHRSGPNSTDSTRRAMYLTFNPASEGDLREEYYRGKLEVLKDRPDRLSLIDSFDGNVTSVQPENGGGVLGVDVPLDALSPSTHTPEQVADAIFALFEARGQDRYDEEVTQTEHALQTAELAAQDGQPESVQLACLLHDIGHLMLGEYKESGSFLATDLKHELVADAFARTWFGAEVADPMLMHVAAKRYLVAIDESYAATLSPSSTRSLELQGGAMNEEERATFERGAHYREAVTLRRFDDLGKQPGFQTRSLADWRSMLIAQIENHASASR